MQGRASRVVIVGMAAAAVGIWLAPASARASGPEVGVNAGAAIPLSKYRRTVDENVGGTFGLEGGYRFRLNDHLSFSLVGNPQFTFMPTEGGCCAEKNDDETGTTFSITGGPRFSLLTGIVETYLGAAGGYYRDMSGPISDDGAGFNGNGGVRFELARGTSLGVFGRYDYANMVAAPGSDVNRQWASAGVAVQHVFEPAPQVAEAPPPPPPAPPPPPVKRKIVLRGVNFDFDKASIRPDARSILDEAVRTLQDEPEIRVSVEGHTDAVGTDGYNQGLSERRAQAVADYLVDAGIARSRLMTEGFGESTPVASNTTDDGRAQNRRVELRILTY